MAPRFPQSKPSTATSKLPSRQPTSQAMSITDRVLVKMLTMKTVTLLLLVRPHKSHNRLPSRIGNREAIKSSHSACRVTIAEMLASSWHTWPKSSALESLLAPTQRRPEAHPRSVTPTTRSTSTDKPTCHHTRIQMSMQFNCSRLTKEIFHQRERSQLPTSRPSSVNSEVTTSRPIQRLLSSSNNISTP